MEITKAFQQRTFELLWVYVPKFRNLTTEILTSVKQLLHRRVLAETCCVLWNCASNSNSIPVHWLESDSTVTANNVRDIPRPMNSFMRCKIWGWLRNYPHLSVGLLLTTDNNTMTRFPTTHHHRPTPGYLFFHSPNPASKHHKISGKIFVILNPITKWSRYTEALF
jgi:hypothetical protein